MRLIPAIALGFVMALASPVAAQQDQTLTDLRGELVELYRDILMLKHQLDPTGLRAVEQPTGDSILDRVIAIEQSLQLLTSRTEELDYRIGQIVADGTNRIGDLEFRLCELEPSCDIGTLGETPSLGGVSLENVPVLTPPTSDENDGLALAERSDFEAAQVAYDEGRYSEATDLFEAFLSNYPGGPLGVQAQIGLGQSLELLGRPRDAASKFLEAFSLNPEGPEAPFALYKLGQMLAAIGQFDESCVMLGEVGRRFPQSGEAILAQDQMISLSCP